MNKINPNLFSRIVDFYGQDAIGSTEIKKFYLGIGNLVNYQDWGNTPTSFTSLSKFDNLIMLKVHSNKYFVKPDQDNGCLITSDGKRWSKVNEITPYIYIQFHYDFNDLPREVENFSQLGIFTNVMNPKNLKLLYPGKDFDLDQSGLMMLENVNTIYKNLGTREIINVVVEITQTEWHTTDAYNSTTFETNYDPNYEYK